MKNKKTVAFCLTGIAAVVLFLIATKIYKKNETERLGFIAEQNFSAFMRPDSPRLGSESAKVFLVEFLDPECESCREFYPYVKELIKEFDGKVQLVVRYAAFHRNSIFVIKVLEASRKQSKYWETLSLLFQSQPYWGNHHNPQPDLIWQYLPSIGVDVEKIRAELEDPKTMQIIEQDRADGQQLGVRGTPTFFVNGKPLERFGKEALREAIQSAIEN